MRLKEDGSVSRELHARIVRAAEAWKEGIAPYIIASGGLTRQGYPTEAEAMAEELKVLGVPAQAVLKEDKSMDTRQNVRNAMAFLPGKRVALVTSDYHCRRAGLLCRRMGLSVKAFPAQLENDAYKRDRVRMERIYILDLLLGYTEKPKPRWAGKLSKLLSFNAEERLRNRNIP